jgi:hypothetical protein
VTFGTQVPCCLHKYIQDEMEFLDISSLGTTYRYAVKIEQKFKQKKRDFGSVNLKQGRCPQTTKTKDKAKVGDPGQPAEAASKEQHHEDKEGHGKMV